MSCFIFTLRVSLTSSHQTVFSNFILFSKDRLDHKKLIKRKGEMNLLDFVEEGRLQF